MGRTGGTDGSAVKAVLAAAAVVLFFPEVGLPQASTPWRTSVDAYRHAIAALEAHAKGQRIEPAYDALMKVREFLMRPGEDGRTVLESFSSETFSGLERELPGALLNRDETVFVAADPDFFVQLAVGHGDAADRQFFAALKATYPESVWPVYVDQQTDYSGCTRFGTGTLVDTFRVWSRFRARFPRRYVEAAQREFDGITEALTRSSCACSDAAAIDRELVQFLRAFRGTPTGGVVDERLQALRSGRSDIRLQCKSG
jgi:hypothetical protein